MGHGVHNIEFTLHENVYTRMYYFNVLYHYGSYEEYSKRFFLYIPKYRFGTPTMAMV